MKIKLYEHDASEEDCKRSDYYAKVDGVEHLLAGSALSSFYTFLEIQAKARKLFGADVEIDTSEVYLETKAH